MSSIENTNSRLQELAAGYSLGDLSEAETQEIKSYDQKNFVAMVERSDEAAARAFLTFQGSVPSDAMPEELSQRLKNMAEGFLEKSMDVGPAKVELATYNVAPSTVGLREIVAWLCVAASVAIALSVWIPGRRDVQTSMLVLRDNLIAKSGDLIRSKWESPTPKQPATPEQTAAQELGDVVWSSSAQQGFMTIRGLPVNDISKEQYQLWIIDPTRDEKPVDGGVFDITNATESIVPIRAKLQVDKPSLFAITIEKPGGVVVSDQKRLPLLAKVIP